MLLGWAGIVINNIKVEKENQNRLARLKDLGSQMEYSYANVEEFDKELKKVTLSITDLVSHLGQFSRRIGIQLQRVGNLIQGVNLEKIHQTLDWINNFADVAFENQSGVKITKLVLQFVVMAVGAITEIGMPIAIALTAFIETIFSLAANIYNMKLLQGRTYQVLCSRYQLVLNEMRCTIVINGLKSIENILKVFLPGFKEIWKKLQQDDYIQRQVLQNALDSLDIDKKIDKVMKDANGVHPEQVIAILKERDSKAGYQDPEVQNGYSYAYDEQHRRSIMSAMAVVSKSGFQAKDSFSFPGEIAPFYSKW